MNQHCKLACVPASQTFQAYQHHSRSTRGPRHAMFQSLEQRCLMTAFSVQDTQSSNTILLEYDPVSPHNLQIFVNTSSSSLPTYSATAGAWPTIDFTGLSGSDSITVDCANQAGLPLPSLLFSGTSHDIITLQHGSFGFNAVAFADVIQPDIKLFSASVTFAGSQSLGAVTLDSFSSIVSVHTEDVRSALSVTGLNLNGGNLDLTDNDLIVSGSVLTTLTDLQQSIHPTASKSFESGIFSSTADADSSHLSTLGVILNSEDGFTPTYSSIDNQPAMATDVIVRCTNFGDANCDGLVDGSDYTRIDNGINSHLSGWANGDFNLDGQVDGGDYTLIDNAFNTQRGNAIPKAAYYSAVTWPQVDLADVNPTPAAGTDAGNPIEYIQFIRGHGEIDFSFIGNECDLYIDAFQANPITATVDGVTTTPEIPSGAYAWVPIDSQSLDDGFTKHAVTIECASGSSWALGSNPNLSIRILSRATTPSIEYFPGFGPEFSLGTNPDFVTLAAGYSVGYQDDSSFGAYNNTYGDAAITFVATTRSISLYTYQGVGTVGLEVDGALQAFVPIHQSGWVTLSTSLDASQPHTYRVSQIQGEFGTGRYISPVNFSNLMFAGGSYSTVPMAAPLRVVCIGDSITLGEEGIYSTIYGYANDLQESLANISVTNMGYGGSTVGGPNGTGLVRANDIANFTIKPDVIVILWGSNDMYAGEDPQAFQSSYTSMLEQMMASDFSSSSSRIFCIGLLPRGGYSQAISDQYSTAASNAVATVNSSQVSYNRAYDWLDYPNDFQHDLLHPTPDGWKKLEEHIQDLIEPGS